MSMNKNYPFNELGQKIQEAQKTLIVLPKNPSFDQVAAALSLFLTLEAAGKNTSTICSSPMTVEFNHLVGVDRIKDKAQGKDLIVSFNYSPDQIERVSYNDDGNRPNVVIQPKTGAPPLTEKLALFSYAGAGADLVISLGIRELSQLRASGVENSQFLINLDTHPSNSQFGQLNIVDSQASSFSEIALAIIAGLGLRLETDTAQNLIDGLWVASQGLTSPQVSADTYEAVAMALRAGAKKPQATVSQPVFTPPKKFEPKEEKSFPSPAKKTESQPKDKPAEEKTQSDSGKPPADWFEPKIFRGTDIS